jgi:hypothetical protein
MTANATILELLEAARLQAIRDSIRHIHARRYRAFACSVQASAVYARIIRRIRGQETPLRVGPRRGVEPLEVRL